MAFDLLNEVSLCTYAFLSDYSIGDIFNGCLSLAARKRKVAFKGKLNIYLPEKRRGILQMFGDTFNAVDFFDEKVCRGIHVNNLVHQTAGPRFFGTILYLVI